MSICDNPIVKIIFPMCSVVENRRMIQAVIVVIIVFIIMLVIVPLFLKERTWTLWISTFAVAAISGFAAYKLDIGGRIAANVAAPGSYTALSTAEELIQ